MDTSEVSVCSVVISVSDEVDWPTIDVVVDVPDCCPIVVADVVATVVFAPRVDCVDMDVGCSVEEVITESSSSSC